ncbi:acyl carrier protein phosphodiesterase [Emticicia sp. 17c]|uniref:acyl carrier protein phosphodiesterase n=1 Tax=Emticicia sp. 17c TaxID=3127704 RepID=UPI00301B8A68
MNFLAHLFLSGDNEEILVGNLLEDFVVGRIEHPRNQHFSENIKNGILLHRLIDSFTDTHSTVSTCKTVLYQNYHKYAAVVIDIYFDHYLSKHWYSYSTEPFDSFRKRVHEAFIKHWTILPEKMKPMIESMIKHDWLKNYGELWGIERSLAGIAKRTAFKSNMENAVEDMKAHYDFFDENFKIFFPEIIRVCTDFLTDKNYTHQHIIVSNKS